MSRRAVPPPSPQRADDIASAKASLQIQHDLRSAGVVAAKPGPRPRFSTAATESRHDTQSANWPVRQ